MTTDSAVLDAMARALAANDDDALETLVNSLTTDAVPTLVTWIDSSDPDRRWWAIRALAMVGNAEAVPAVARGLRDDDAGTRAAAALALGHMHVRSPHAVTAQLAAVGACLADDEGFVRQVATDALAMCGDDAVPVLAEVLRGEHDGARTRAALALGKIATMKAAAVLYQHLNDPNYLVRSYAYEALDEMGLLENLLLKP
jgi:HEAT repeat protein